MPRLYDRMDDLLKIDVAIPYIADLLTEVFTGGPELCLKVREEQVEKLFQMVASLGEKKGRTELIVTLQAISKVIIVLEEVRVLYPFYKCILCFYSTHKSLLCSVVESSTINRFVG